MLAAAYAQVGRSADAARVAENIRQTDPTFDAATFGNKFLNPKDLEHLREGLRKAGLLVERASRAQCFFGSSSRLRFACSMLALQSLRNSSGPMALPNR